MWKCEEKKAICVCVCVCGLSYHTELQCLLKREVVSDPLAAEDVMISQGMNTQPPASPPDSCLITAQLEVTTLTHADYRSISSLMSSVLCLSTGALVYVGHTLSPLTLHWHCSEAKNNPVFSTGLLTEMAQTGIRKIHIGDKLVSIIPQRNVSMCSTLYHIMDSTYRPLFLTVV